MRRRSVAGFLTFLAALAGAGCSDSPTAPSGPFLPSGMSIRSLIITGNTSLTTIGQTSQLTATVTFSDGTTRDVTLESEWRSTDPSVLSVSSSGLVTVVAFGVGGIEAWYGSRASGRLQLSAWPPGTFAVSGRVREPGQSGLENVRVRDPQSGRETLTSRDGMFFLGGVTGPHLTFEKEGYETAQHEVGPNQSQSADVAMQRVIRIRAGDTVTPLQLAPHDLSYVVGADRCFPCRRVRVVTPASGTLQLGVTWTDARAALHVWANGRVFRGAHPELTIDLPVSSGEIVLYVGMALPAAADSSGFYVPFTLATAMR